MTGPDVLRFVIGALEQSKIPYALAGSLAAMSYGEPRSTLDLDVVVALAPGDVPRLAALFPRPDFHFDEISARAAAERGGQFNVIHPASGWKIDFFVVSDEIEQSQIERRQMRLALPGLRAAFSPPEELIIKKLMYYRAGGSEKHLRDVGAMLAVSAEHIDRGRVAELAQQQGLSEIWKEVRERALG